MLLAGMEPPLLALTLDNVGKQRRETVVDDLLALWTVAAKVKSELADGARIENLAWRCLFQATRKSESCVELGDSPIEEPLSQEPRAAQATPRLSENDKNRANLKSPPRESRSERKSVGRTSERILRHSEEERPNAGCITTEKSTNRKAQSPIPAEHHKTQSATFTPGSLQDLITAILPMGLRSPPPPNLVQRSPPTMLCLNNSQNNSTSREHDGVDDSANEETDVELPKGKPGLPQRTKSKSTISTSHIHPTTRRAIHHKPQKRPPAHNRLRSSHGHPQPAANPTELVRPTTPTRPPALAQRHSGTSDSSQPVTRNASFKSVRIAEQPTTLLGGSGSASDLRRVASAAAMSRRVSADLTIANARRASRDQIAPLAGVLKRGSSSIAVDKSMNMDGIARSIGSESGPRSVVKGFAEPTSTNVNTISWPEASSSREVSTSVNSAVYPQPPNTSPADRPLPIYALASGPSTNGLAREPKQEPEMAPSSLPTLTAPPPTPAGSVLPSRGLAQIQKLSLKPDLDQSLIESKKKRGKNKFFIQSASIGSDSDGDGSLSPGLPLRPPEMTAPKPRRRSTENNVPITSSSLKKSTVFPERLEKSSVASTAEWEDDESSGWGSETSEEESRPAEKKKSKRPNLPPMLALPSKASPEAQKAKSNGLFVKRVPTAPSPLNRIESKSALTQLLHPDEDDGILRNPSAVGLVMMAGGKSSNEALPVRRGMQPSKSAVALPVLSFNSAYQPAIRPPKTKTAGRLGGRPANVEMSDDSSSEGEAPASQTLFAQDKELAAAIARQRIREMPAAMPQDPVLTRRNLIENEMSISLRKDVLWERQSRSRLASRTSSSGLTGGNGRRTSGAHPHTAPQLRYDAAGNPLPANETPFTTSQRPDYFHEHGW